jgi:uncharacterized protein (DUF1697 family)
VWGGRSAGSRAPDGFCLPRTLSYRELMSKYVAFLKAINVGGHVVKMDELRELFAGMKFSNVETFIASGNVIFETKSAPDQKLEEKIEKHLEAALGYAVGTFVRSMEEIRAIGEYQPFSNKGLVLNVGFMRGALSAGVVEQVMGFKTDVDDFHVHGREVYWLCQIRQSDSKFPAKAKKFEKAIGGEATWRNMNTVVRLTEKYSL